MYLSERINLEDNLLFEMEEYLSRTIYNPHSSNDMKIIRELFGSMRIRALEALVSISEANWMTLDRLNITDHLL